MSTKTSFLLTEDDEHIYIDSSLPHFDENKWIGDSIIVEFSKKNAKVIYDDKDDLIIEIFNPKSEIHNYFGCL